MSRDTWCTLLPALRYHKSAPPTRRQSRSSGRQSSRSRVAFAATEAAEAAEAAEADRNSIRHRGQPVPVKFCQPTAASAPHFCPRRTPAACPVRIQQGGTVIFTTRTAGPRGRGTSRGFEISPADTDLTLSLFFNSTATTNAHLSNSSAGVVHQTSPQCPAQSPAMLHQRRVPVSPHRCHRQNMR